MARYGGDEFIIFLNDTNVEKSPESHRKNREKDSRKFKFKVKDKVFKVTCSIGVGGLKTTWIWSLD